MASKHPITSRDILSGDVKTQDCTLRVESGVHRQSQIQKPWVDLHSFWIYVSTRRQRLGVLFRRKSRREPDVLEGREGYSQPSLHQSSKTGSPARSRQTDIRTHNKAAIGPDTANGPGGIIATAQHIGPQLEDNAQAASITEVPYRLL